MPGLAAFGSRSARAFGFATSVTIPAAFVAENHYRTDAPVAVSFSGMAAGDLALIFTVAAQTTPPAGWAATASGTTGPYATAVFAKLLSAGDISTGSVTMTGNTGGGIAIAAWRGPTAATQKSTATSTDTTLVVPGFTKPHGTSAVVTYVLSAAGHSSPGYPAGTTGRLSYSTGSVATGIADIIPPTSYGNGSPLTWSGLVAGTFGSQGGAIALT